ncbi:glycosyltransferase [bacterium]|nr:glycosyltransferase [bacterium]
MKFDYPLKTIDDYESITGSEALNRIRMKAKPLEKRNVVHVNSTYYGGGVAEILSVLTLLMNSLGIKTEWRLIQGSPDFFGITKKMHNALQGRPNEINEMEKRIYESTIYENSVRKKLDHDFVVIHDPQPLPLIHYFEKKGPWIWRCHIDLSSPNRTVWQYLKPYICYYDAMIVSIREFRKKIHVPQRLFMPAIDPFSLKNRPLSEEEIKKQLENHGIPTDLPLIVQISRFDRWKDPLGVIKAFKQARKQVDATLVLLGNAAMDDPEGEQVFESLLMHRQERIIIISHENSLLVNALQRKAAVVLQKSIREGFGLTVSEALWKGTPVIGGRVGGIRYQIRDGENGFLVSSIRDAADRIVLLLKDEALRSQMSKRGREIVQDQFLMSRLVEQYLDLFNSFETVFRIKK